MTGQCSSTASCNCQEDSMDWLDSRGKKQSRNCYLKHLSGSLHAEEGRQKLHDSSTTCIQRDQSLDLKLKTHLLENMQSSKYWKMFEFRKKLPSYNMRKVTQFLLDHYIQEGKGSLCHIVCTQPRHISAISVAERVAEERAESCGKNSSIGYQIRLECKLPREKGSILYCTTGILLQRIQNDPCLSNISHIILDEIHERDLDSEFLMIILKDLLKQ
ncbi:ATP-dependent DNA/RNA helicase DHX36-like [Tachypleus tridentatus]|uniref:ATP-dependent DNA/RNA helicase DHX36-like n=1 Tax=Tachypleus tridentatus TaxID=6853 RepID=UPI003FD085B8